MVGVVTSDRDFGAGQGQRRPADGSCDGDEPGWHVPFYLYQPGTTYEARGSRARGHYPNGLRGLSDPIAWRPARSRAHGRAWAVTGAKIPANSRFSPGP